MPKLSLHGLEDSKDIEPFFDPAKTLSNYASNEARINTDRALILFSHERFNIISTGLIALVMAVMLSQNIQTSIVIAWFITVQITLLLRHQLYSRFKKNHHENIRPEKWLQRYFLLTLFSGISIGSLGLANFATDDYATQTILMFSLAILISIAVATLSCDHKIFMSFALPVVLPFAFHEILFATAANAGLGALVLLFTAIITVLTDRMQLSLKSSLAIRYENSLLLDDLIKTKTKLEDKNQQLEITSREDYLTGLANRRYFDTYMQKEWNKAIRYQREISVVLIDVDQFKAYNDNYGHLAGDECLKIVAETLKATLSRPSDLAARYGGEEFIIVLPDTDIHGAEAVAERVRLLLNKINVPHEHSATAGHVTISAGVASATPDRKSLLNRLIADADSAMYRAKASGGDITVIRNNLL